MIYAGFVPFIQASNYWCCNGCTHSNEHGRRKCVQCGTTKNGYSGGGGDTWRCSQCTFINEGQRSKCSACGAYNEFATDEITSLRTSKIFATH
uniref:RanBP2-type domain-containing protein n=1 Tax=Magallana gigas TaxID=29159 RepID=K1RPT4_MAGGI